MRRVELNIWEKVVAIVLFTTSFAKAVSLVHPARLVYQSDFVFGIQLLKVIAFASLLEFALFLGVCFFFRRIVTAVSIFAFALSILAYRIIAYANGEGYCFCLSKVGDWWPWLGQHEGQVMTTVSIWLFLTSAFKLLEHVQTHSTDPRINDS